MTRWGRLRDRLSAFLVRLAARVWSGSEVDCDEAAAVHVFTLLRRGWRVNVERPGEVLATWGPSDPCSDAVRAWGDAYETMRANPFPDFAGLRTPEEVNAAWRDFLEDIPLVPESFSACGFGASPYEAIPPSDLPTLDRVRHEPFADVPGEGFAHLKDGGS